MFPSVRYGRRKADYDALRSPERQSSDLDRCREACAKFGDFPVDGVETGERGGWDRKAGAVLAGPPSVPTVRVELGLPEWTVVARGVYAWTRPFPEAGARTGALVNSFRGETSR